MSTINQKVGLIKLFLYKINKIDHFICFLIHSRKLRYLLKRAKIARGVLNTYVRRNGQKYDDTKWWDASFYTKGVSDRQTISQKKSVISAKYHYASMELLILRHMRNNQISINQADIVDVGSGSGHWIDFYKSLEPETITAMDVSLLSFNHLKKKYAEDSSIEIHHGKALETLNGLSGKYNLINAIGIMFHIVDDFEWHKTIYEIGKKMKTGGVFVVGGHFGVLDGLNVQIDKDGKINKRLRSKRRWTHELKTAGFRSITVYRNNAYLWIKDTLPENSVLIGNYSASFLRFPFAVFGKSGSCPPKRSSKA